MGHVGLTPQTATSLGGYRSQGRTAERALRVLHDALALQEAGCFAIVFEAIPSALTEAIMPRMEIPVIGIGAGAAADGQVLVFHDLLGIYSGHVARFVKRYADRARRDDQGRERVRGRGARAQVPRGGARVHDGAGRDRAAPRAASRGDRGTVHGRFLAVAQPRRPRTGWGAMTRFRRLIPSPAMAVALLALFMAMGGSAYALVVTSGSIKNNTIRSKDVRNSGLVGKDVRSDGFGGRAIKESTLGTVPSALVADGSTHFAVVNAGGQQVRARGTTSAARTAEGRYQVIFDRDVRGCGYYATVGGPTAAAPPDNGQITRQRARLERRTGWTSDDREPEREQHEQAVPPTRSLLSPLLGGYSTRRSTFAGAPAAIEYGGMSSVTTLLAPITQRSPMVTPLVTTTFAPHQTLSPTRVGPLLVKPCHVIG